MQTDRLGQDVPEAQLSAALAALFPPGVTAAELRLPPLLSVRAVLAEQTHLSAEEAVCIMHCHERRIQDFAAGRLCARRVLEQLGVRGFSLLPGPDRDPRWPEGLVGSITHTEGYSAAVVGPRERFASLGIDCERIDEVQPSLWREICCPQELHELLLTAPHERRRVAALTFVAKEAFYKCQFPLTRERLGFDALRIQRLPGAPGWNGIGEFCVLANRPLRLQTLTPAPAPWTGRYRCEGNFLTAGVALPAATAQ